MNRKLPGHGNCSHTSGLSNCDEAGLCVTMSMKYLRELSTLPRTSFSNYNHHWIFIHCFHDLLFKLKDRKIRHITEIHSQNLSSSTIDKNNLYLLFLLSFNQIHPPTNDAVGSQITETLVALRHYEKFRINTIFLKPFDSKLFPLYYWDYRF